MQAMIEANPKSMPAYLARARFWMAQQAFTSAAQDVEKARKLAPADLEVLLVDAQLAPFEGWCAELGNQLRDAVGKHPRDERLVTALARFQLASGRRKDGIETLRRGLQVLPAQPDLLAMLAESCIQDGQTGEANDLIRRLEKSSGASAIAGYLRSLVLMQNHKFDEAATVLHSIRSGLAPWPEAASRAELELAECYERLGDRQEALSAQHRAVRNDPNSAL